MASIDEERDLLLRQALAIAEGVAATFAPFCEVAVHDLLDPGNAIVALHNNLSGRSIGDPTTELGFARVADPDHPQVVTNYANRFCDGRPVKSTSIGVKDSTGTYIASLCLNIDLSFFDALSSALASFTATVPGDGSHESLDSHGAAALRARVESFAHERATTPQLLSRTQRRELVAELRDSGLLDLRRAMPILADQLGVSRATVYADAR